MHRLNREFILSGGLADAIRDAERLGFLRIATPDERAQSLRETLAGHRPDQDVWVFGYGSLLWNPAFEFAETTPCRVYGWHRSFCKWGHAGRGTPEKPTLVLALDRGGSCHGAAFRIPADRVERELGVIWGREMIALTYRPIWVRAHAAGGVRRAITFVADHTASHYTGSLPLEQIARILAHAEGVLGTSTQYLESTVAHLSELGIVDRYLSRLLTLVNQHHAAGCG